MTYNNENSTNSIDPVITITNTDDKELNLEDLNIQYYYQCNGESEEVFECYYAGTVDGEYKNLSDNVEGTIKKSDEGRYADITFNGGSLEKGQSMSIQASVHKIDWTNYDAVDKSLSRTNAYIDGKLVYGDDSGKVQDYNEVKMSIEGGEYNYSEKGYISVNVDSLDYYKGIYSCEAEIKYDPDQVKIDYVYGKELIDDRENFKYEDDEENGILKITYKADNLIDSSDLGDKASLCRIALKCVNGEMGSESSLEISGTASTIDNPDHKIPINNINSGKVIFKGKEGIDLSMPVLENGFVDITPVYADEYIRLKINENGNKFLGVKELEEGIDYTFKDKFLTLNRNAIQKYLRENEIESVYDFSLNFENNIRKNLTIGYFSEGVVSTSINIDEAKGKRGELVKVPINIRHGGDYDLLTQCDFNLKYDTDMFEDVAIECDDKNGKLNWEVDKETGIVHAIYDRYNDSIDDQIKSQEISMNLVLKIKENSPVGDTRIGFYKDKFTLNNSKSEYVFCLGERRVIVEK